MPLSTQLCGVPYCTARWDGWDGCQKGEGMSQWMPHELRLSLARRASRAQELTGVATCRHGYIQDLNQAWHPEWAKDLILRLVPRQDAW